VFTNDPLVMRESLLLDTIDHALHKCLNAVEHLRKRFSRLLRFITACPISRHSLSSCSGRAPLFLRALGKSSLLLVLLHHVKSDPVIIDFVSVASDRDAQHFLIRLDYVQFFTESFFDVEKRRSVVDFFACDFSRDSETR
jgi:hypothetical protein